MRKYLGLLVVNNFRVKGPLQIFDMVPNTSISPYTIYTQQRFRRVHQVLTEVIGLKSTGMKAYADISHIILGNAGGFVANIRQNT